MNAKAKIRFQVGILIASQIVTQLKVGAFDYGVRVEVEHLGGFFEKHYSAVVEGEATAVIAYTKAVNTWFKNLIEEE